jgi:hypothetical protein
MCERIKQPPNAGRGGLFVGLVKGASEGAGLGNDFLSNIQAMDGLYHVVRAFDNDEIIHVDDSVDPVRSQRPPTASSRPDLGVESDPPRASVPCT